MVIERYIPPPPAASPGGLEINLEDPAESVRSPGEGVTRSLLEEETVLTVF